MQWIADNLFVGNKLTAGALHTGDGVRIDLRNIRSPIVVFCSWGDDITPPQQALGWVTDLYDDDREIVANGQTIVYTLHQNIGHLGIFVSGKVATREHQEFASAMDLIDLAPPGLYEAVITDVGEDTENPELIEGRYLFRMERRTLADIRALGNNDAEDQLRFATAARVSEANLALYRSTLAPMVRAMTTEQTAETMRKLHPARLKFGLLSDQNPAMQPVKALADTIRANRKPVPADNPLLAMERMASDWIIGSLDAVAAARDTMEEQVFLTTYGSPWLQSLMGFGPDAAGTLKRADHDVLRAATEARLRADLESRFDAGGLAEAVIRALVYIRLPEQRSTSADLQSPKRCGGSAGRAAAQPAAGEGVVSRPVPAADDGSWPGGARAAGPVAAGPSIRQAALADIHRVLPASGRMSGGRAPAAGGDRGGVRHRRPSPGSAVPACQSRWRPPGSGRPVPGAQGRPTQAPAAVPVHAARPSPAGHQLMHGRRRHAAKRAAPEGLAAEDATAEGARTNARRSHS